MFFAGGKRVDTVELLYGKSCCVRDREEDLVSNSEAIPVL